MEGDNVTVCPNCNSEVRAHEFCRKCGYNFHRDENYGDNSTEYMNVFRIGGEFAYIFSVNGKQVVIRNENLEELLVLVKDKQFPIVRL